MGSINWNDELDAILRDGYSHGRPDIAIAEEVALMMGSRCTRQHINARASVLKLRGKKQQSPFDELAPRFQRMKVSVKAGDRLVVFNDCQVPYHDYKTLKAIEQFMIDFEPTAIINAGDFLDFYQLSDFDKNPNRVKGVGLQDELDIGRVLLTRWGSQNPKARKILIQGNHEDRLRRFIWRHPGVAGLRDLDLARLMRVEDEWEVLPYKSLVEYGSLLIEHGDLVRQHSAYTAKAMFEKRGSSGIVGHTHRFGVYSRTDATNDFIYVENGCTCRLDPEYAPFPNWQQSFTYAIAHGPKSLAVVPVPITKKGFRAEGRWYGRGDR